MSNAYIPAAARNPTCLIAPPNNFLIRSAFAMCVLEPNSIEPTGAPNPLDRQIEIVSNNSPYCLGVSFFATRALNNLAPSK